MIVKNHSAKLAQNQQLDGSSAKTAWRSMASAPRDGRPITVRFMNELDVATYVDAAGGDWYVGWFGIVSDEDIEAWAPIPEWTGEVAD